MNWLNRLSKAIILHFFHIKGQQEMMNSNSFSFFLIFSLSISPASWKQLFFSIDCRLRWNTIIYNNIAWSGIMHRFVKCWKLKYLYILLDSSAFDFILNIVSTNSTNLLHENENKQTDTCTDLCIWPSRNKKSRVVFFMFWHLLFFNLISWHCHLFVFIIINGNRLNYM